jgi:hypothetical protein
MPVVLNQYRRLSGYKDVVGERYHLPNRYLKALGHVPQPFLYYEPRVGGKQVYFGTGIVRAITPDSEDTSHSYADIDSYRKFVNPVSHFSGPNAKSWEPASMMQRSVRPILSELFDQMVRAGGLEPEPAGAAIPTLYEDRLRAMLEELQGRTDPPSLRKKRRILEAYERPSWVTNLVKTHRGDTCQLCSTRGFVKRDGQRYCEVHHLFHLSEVPPDHCLGPEYVVVLCATCHRRLHYAKVGQPRRVEAGWEIEIDGAIAFFRIEALVVAPKVKD